MPRLLEATRTARRDRILDVAVACFARGGYHQTTMDEIAAEAGIAKGAPYRYFDGKEAIFLALYDAWGCGLRDEIDAALAALPAVERASPRTTLRVVLAMTGRHVAAQATLCRVLLEGRHLAAYIPAIAERTAREQSSGQRQIEDLLRAGVAVGEWPAETDIRTRATLLRAALHGLMVTWHAAPGSFDWNAAAAALVAW